MNRGSFIRNIFALGAGSMLPRKLHSYKKIYLLECFVAGFQYYEGPALLDTMHAGDTLLLRREHDNDMDPKAIAIYANSQKIGFIPARENKMLSRLLDADIVPVIAEITHVRQDVAHWENVRIAVYMLKQQYGPVPPHAVYLTKPGQPEYRSVRTKRRRDWYNILVDESKTDHIYSLIYDDLYPDFPVQNHDGDFVVARESRIPAFFREQYQADTAMAAPDIKAPYGPNDYLLIKTDRLANYLEAAKRMEAVVDTIGNNYIELHFL